MLATTRPPRFQLLHFDSAYATYLTDANSSTGNISTPYRAQFAMNQTFRNVKRVYLKSLELPVGFCNVRTGSTATLTMLVNGTSYSVVLAEKNYATAAALTADLTTACVGLVSGVTITFSVTTSTTTPSRVLATLVGASTFSVVSTNLSRFILGFRASRDSLSSGVYAANSNYNLAPDNYMLLHIPSLNGMNASVGGPLQSTFKIPLNSTNNQIYYYFENASFAQFVDIYDPNMVLAGLVVYVLDRFGNSLSPNGLDYSFTLGIDYLV